MLLPEPTAFRAKAGDTMQDHGVVDRFLKERGPGLHRIAFKVMDIETHLVRLERAGYRMIDKAGCSGAPVSHRLHPSELDAEDTDPPRRTTRPVTRRMGAPNARPLRRYFTWPASPWRSRGRGGPSSSETATFPDTADPASR